MGTTEQDRTHSRGVIFLRVASSHITVKSQLRSKRELPFHCSQSNSSLTLPVTLMLSASMPRLPRSEVAEGAILLVESVVLLEIGVRHALGYTKIDVDFVGGRRG